MQPVLHSVVKDSFKKNNKSFYRLRKLYAEEITSRFAGFYALLFGRFYLKITSNYVVSSYISLLRSSLM